MLKFSLVEWFLKKDSTKSYLPLLAIIVAPVFIIAGYSYLKANDVLTAMEFSNKQTVAQVAAVNLQERFDRLIDVGISLSTRVNMRKQIGLGNWVEAVQILNTVRSDFPYIQRIFITDPNGILKSDIPEVKAVHGRSFADRDWYKKVSLDWKPSISEVYTRAAEPPVSVIAAAIPIKTDDGKVIGILVLQLPVEVVIEWTKSIEIGPSGMIYFIDARGHVAGHPDFVGSKPIPDHSQEPIVQKVLSGQRGVEIQWDPIEKAKWVVAYENLPKYGWGVIVRQTANRAFAQRDASLRFLLLFYSIVIIASCLIGFLGLRILESLRTTREKLHLLNEQLVHVNEELELRIQERTRNLTRSNKELESFAYAASHDLQEPIRMIALTTQLFLDRHSGDWGPKELKEIQFIDRATRQMKALVDGLLEFSRLAAGIKISFEEVNTESAVSQALAALKLPIEETNAKITYDSLPILQANHSAMVQLFQNLIANAIKYRGPATPEIQISAQYQDNTWRFAISDNGMGIEAEFKEYIFLLFKRLHSKDAYLGAGIGLSLCKKIVEYFNGRIWVESTPGKGSTFYFTIPDPGAGGAG